MCSAVNELTFVKLLEPCLVIVRGPDGSADFILKRRKLGLSEVLPLVSVTWSVMSKAWGSDRVCVPLGSLFYLPEFTASERSVNIYHIKWNHMGFFAFPDGTSGKEPACQCRRHEMWVWSPGREDPLEEGMATHSSVPGESHGQRSLAGYSPWDHKELDTTEAS